MNAPIKLPKEKARTHFTWRACTEVCYDIGTCMHSLSACLNGPRFFAGGHDVLVCAKLVLDDGVKMQLSVRSSDATVPEVVASAVG